MKQNNKLQAYIKQLANVGRKGNVLWRAGYTDEYLVAINLLKKWMKEIGLNVIVDEAGNISGRTNFRSREKVILTGSHLDTVKDGGPYDGVAGVICSLLAVEELLDEKGIPARPVEVVGLIEEEGSRFHKGYVGSRAMIEGLTEKDLKEEDPSGTTLQEAIKLAGFSYNKSTGAIRDDIASFIELHIEQGPVLEQEGLDLGIVENITGLSILSLVVDGREDHAGTTPMNYRLDALTGAAEVLSDLPSLALDISSTARITAGSVSVYPNITNVVPKRVEIILDVRDITIAGLERLESVIKTRALSLKKDGYKVTLDKIGIAHPVALNDNLQKKVKKIADSRSLKSRFMNSGAGHDAQIFAGKVPSSLIFVPSKNGRSHSPDEFTDLKDLRNGLAVLKELLYDLAW